MCIIIASESISCDMTHTSDMYYNAGPEKLKCYSIEAIEEDDIDHIIEMCVKLFSEATNFDYPGLFFYGMTDFSISKKAVLDGKIIGCYLLNGESVQTYNINRLEDLDKCLEVMGICNIQSSCICTNIYNPNKS